METIIFWNHVGREHGGLQYVSDIRKNGKEGIENTLALKEERARNSPNQFYKYNKSTLIELPPIASEKKFIIIYQMDKGLQYSLNLKSKYPWWLIDIVDIQEIKPNVFCAFDLFLDISVNRDGSYNVLDVDDFELAIRLDVINQTQVLSSLASFHSVIEQLNEKKFPCALIEEITEKYDIK